MRQLKNISIFVIGAHLSCILYCLWFGGFSPEKKATEKLVVKTVTLKNKLEPLIAMAEPAAAKPPPPAPKPEVKPEVKPETKPEVKPEVKHEAKSEPPLPPKPVAKPKKETKPAALKPPEKKTPVAKKQPAPPSKPQVSKEDIRKQELIAKAQSLFKKSGKQVSDPKLASVGTLGKLEIDSPGSVADKERRYQDILAAHLKDRLKFPDYGEVKIKLTLDSSGKVLKVEIVSSKSDDNRNYATKTLPTILFPSFSSFFKEDKHTFAVTLKNE